MGERKRLEQIWLKHPNTFRMDQGTGYVGGKATLNKSGTWDVFGARKIRYGIDGAGDRIGWTEKEITQDMVGQKVAIFTSIEDKSATDRIGYNQLVFLLNVLKAGGIAMVYKEGEQLDLEQALNLPRRKDTKKLAGIVERLRGEV